MALVFPVVMLMQMIAAGAMGGGISSAIARAIGGGRRDEADALVLHGIVIHIALGLLFSAIMLPFGLPIYRALGGSGGELQAALIYSNVVFSGNVVIWILNALSSAIRGTGNMLVPAVVISVGVVVLVPLSPCLIFGIGPFPALGIAGGALAFLIYNAAGTAVLGWYVLSGRNAARLRLAPLRWRLISSILGVGAWSSISSVQTNVIIASATALVASVAGANAVAGYGTGARLEYLLIPLVFGLGAPLVAMVGTNIGAGQYQRALRIGLNGGAIAFAITETLWAGDRHVAAYLDWTVQHRSARDCRRQRLSARGRTVLRLLRPGTCALFRLAGRWTRGLAATRRFCPDDSRDRRRLRRAAHLRLAELAIRRACRGAGFAGHDRAWGGARGRLAPNQAGNRKPAIGRRPASLRQSRRHQTDLAANAAVAPVYASFTEGFDFVDVRETRVFLDSL